VRLTVEAVEGAAAFRVASGPAVVGRGYGRISEASLLSRMGAGGYGPAYGPVYGNPYGMNPQDELQMLRDQADAIKNILKRSPSASRSWNPSPRIVSKLPRSLSFSLSPVLGEGKREHRM